MNDTPNKLPAVKAGAQLTTFVPTDMDELWRMAKWAAIGGMAPKSLVDGKDIEGATSAVAIAIMAGAELGLTPMMALRSYAVINGRPSLWGDGLIAVVQKSSVYKPGSLKRGGDAKMGWAEAERVDGTKHREEFTWEQATIAGLTSKDLYKKYPDVMLQRRAISKCLNFLFADVLGGMVTADEAYDDGAMIDVTPKADTLPPPPPPPPVVEKTPAELLNDLAWWLSTANTQEQIDSVFEEVIGHDADPTLHEKAIALKTEREDQIKKPGSEGPVEKEKLP